MTDTSDEATHTGHPATDPTAEKPKASLRKIVLTSVITVVALVGITVGGFLWKSSVPYESHRPPKPYEYSSAEYGFSATFSDFASEPSKEDFDPGEGGLILTNSLGEMLEVVRVGDDFMADDRDEALTSLYTSYIEGMPGAQSAGFNIADLQGERALSGTVQTKGNVTLDCLLVLHNGSYYSLVVRVNSADPSEFIRSFSLLE